MVIPLCSFFGWLFALVDKNQKLSLSDVYKSNVKSVKNRLNTVRHHYMLRQMKEGKKNPTRVVLR